MHYSSILYGWGEAEKNLQVNVHSTNTAPSAAKSSAISRRAAAPSGHASPSAVPRRAHQPSPRACTRYAGTGGNGIAMGLSCTQPEQAMLARYASPCMLARWLTREARSSHLLKARHLPLPLAAYAARLRSSRTWRAAARLIIGHRSLRHRQTDRRSRKQAQAHAHALNVLPNASRRVRYGGLLRLPPQIHINSPIAPLPPHSRLRRPPSAHQPNPSSSTITSLTSRCTSLSLGGWGHWSRWCLAAFYHLRSVCASPLSRPRWRGASRSILRSSCSPAGSGAWPCAA